MAVTVNGTTGVSLVQDGIIALADLSATGTPSASTFLRGDNAWAAPASGAFTTLGTVSGSGTTMRFSGIDCSAHKFLLFSCVALTAASIANPIFKLGSLDATSSTGDWIPGNCTTPTTMEGLIWLDTSNNTGIITMGYYTPVLAAGDSAYAGAGCHKMMYSKGSNIQLQTSADIDFTLAGGVAYTGGSITLYGVS